jgi:hypothetical protein
MSKARGKLVQSHNKVVQKYLVNPRSWLVTLIRTGDTCPFVGPCSLHSITVRCRRIGQHKSTYKPLIWYTRSSSTLATVLITKLRNHCHIYSIDRRTLGQFFFFLSIRTLRMG